MLLTFSLSESSILSSLLISKSSNVSDIWQNLKELIIISSENCFYDYFTHPYTSPILVCQRLPSAVWSASSLAIYKYHSFLRLFLNSLLIATSRG